MVGNGLRTQLNMGENPEFTIIGKINHFEQILFREYGYKEIRLLNTILYFNLPPYSWL